jgi:hypothetical protein
MHGEFKGDNEEKEVNRPAANLEWKEFHTFLFRVKDSGGYVFSLLPFYFFL